MPRVAGTDPGTSSLDVVTCDDGAVIDQARFTPQQILDDPTAPVRWLQERGPFALIAGPSGYGLPLKSLRDCDDNDLALMTLVRLEERGRRQGVTGFSALLAALRQSSLPVMCLPGVIHLPTVPEHRKLRRIDLGTPDKLAVAALAIHQQTATGVPLEDCHLGVIELGSVFSAVLAIRGGQVVDGLGGTSGPVGWGGGGAWDGEVAYWRQPLTKGDLFAGGASGRGEIGRRWLRESLVKAVASLQAVMPLPTLMLSGRLLELEPALAEEIAADLARLGKVERLAALPGAWVKRAAQGAALLADGLVGGRHAALVERLQLRGATGTALGWVE
jgi:predicted butyrate kinase (DUF1464 family)